MPWLCRRRDVRGRVGGGVFSETITPPKARLSPDRVISRVYQPAKHPFDLSAQGGRSVDQDVELQRLPGPSFDDVGSKNGRLNRRSCLKPNARRSSNLAWAKVGSKPTSVALKLAAESRRFQTPSTSPPATSNRGANRSTRSVWPLGMGCCSRRRSIIFSTAVSSRLPTPAKRSSHRLPTLTRCAGWVSILAIRHGSAASIRTRNTSSSATGLRFSSKA